jgi:16S rRNA (cytosine1407-C5)-methyltransferase
MVYCTCSFAPEENEAIVDYALKRFADAIEIEPLRLPVGNTQSALATWKNKTFHPDVQQALRILPNELMDGFFLCRIKKQRSTKS